MYPEVLFPLLERGQGEGRWQELRPWELPSCHEPLDMGGRDGASQGSQLGQPRATLGSGQTPPWRAPLVLLPQGAAATSSTSCSYCSMSRGCACSSHLGVSWWERDLLPSAEGGQSCAAMCLVPAPLALVLYHNSCHGQGFVGFLIFLFFFSPFFPSCAQSPLALLGRLWHIILQMWHRSPGCKIYPAWQLVVLCNLHQLTETTVRYY